MKDKELLLYYMCDRGYDYFIPLFCYFASKSNPEARIEIWTQDIEKFLPLTEMFDLCLYPLPDTQHVNTLRFLYEPINQLKYTYIGDIDILLLNNVLQFHRPLLNTKVPVSNWLRPTKPPRITGLQCVLSDPYFNDTREYRAELMEEFYPQYNDEFVLYKLISKIYGEDILTVLNVKAQRPVFGIHCSPHRTPCGDPGWGLNHGRKETVSNWLQLPEFNKVRPHLQPKAQRIVDYFTVPGYVWEEANSDKTDS